MLKHLKLEMEPLLLATLVLLALVAPQTRAELDVDVVKTTSATGVDANQLEAVVVSQGFVSSAFAVESSLMDGFIPSFLPRSFRFPFSLYREQDAQSRFVVTSRTAPVVVSGYGVVDGNGAITTKDSGLAVAAVLRAHETRGKGFAYHLELNYECKEPETERLVAVRLRLSPEDAPANNHEDEVTFVFKKACPSPPAREDVGRGWLTLWVGPSFFRVQEMSMNSVEGEREWGRVRAHGHHGRPGAVEDKVKGSGHGRGHHKRPDKHHPYKSTDKPNAIDELWQWLNEAPKWLQEGAKTALLAGVAGAVLILAVELVRGLRGRAGEDGEEASEDEIESLLTGGESESSEYQQLPQVEPIKTSQPTCKEGNKPIAQQPITTDQANDEGIASVQEECQ